MGVATRVGFKNSKALAELAKAMVSRRRQEERERLSKRRNAPVANDPYAGVITAETARHGDYERHNGRTVNRGGTPISRWEKAGLISEPQQAAIRHCLRLWETVSSSGRLVSNLDRTVFGCQGDGNVAEIEARDDLARIKGGFPFTYWSIFENVCRFDEPAGVAGSKLAEDDVTRRTMARTIVCMVADLIYMRERLSY